MNEFYLIAEVKSVYGKDGFVSVISHSDFPDRFFELKKVYIEIFEDKKEFYIEKVKKLEKYFILKFRNFNSNDEVEFLIGKKIFVDSENLVKLTDNIYFIHDIIGSSVLRNDVLLGIVKDVITLPSNDIYVIEDISGKELLIPAVNDFIKEFFPEKKILVLKPGEGSFYEDDEN